MWWVWSLRYSAYVSIARYSNRKGEVHRKHPPCARSENLRALSSKKSVGLCKSAQGVRPRINKCTVARAIINPKMWPGLHFECSRGYKNQARVKIRVLQNLTAASILAKCLFEDLRSYCILEIEGQDSAPTSLNTPKSDRRSPKSYLSAENSAPINAMRTDSRNG